MKKVLVEGLVILSIYLLFGLYLIMASERIERLDNETDTEYVNVSLKYNK